MMWSFEDASRQGCKSSSVTNEKDFCSRLPVNFGIEVHCRLLSSLTNILSLRAGLVPAKLYL